MRESLKSRQDVSFHNLFVMDSTDFRFFCAAALDTVSDIVVATQKRMVKKRFIRYMDLFRQQSDYRFDGMGIY